MNRFSLLFLSLLSSCPLATLAAQDDAAATPSSAPTEARQFDFLLGQWQIEAHPKVSSLVAMIHGSPRLVGTWKATRSADGLGIEDELRIVDGSGNPISLSRALRTFIKTDGRWKVSGTDVTHATTSEASGQWLGGEMRMDGHSADAEGKPILTRTRYYGIAADSFHMQQDRSIDNGQSWEEAVITIDARRVADTATP